MKRHLSLYLLILSCVCLLLLASRANSAQPQLQVMLKGVDTDILNNIQISLQAEEKKFNSPLSAAEVTAFFKQSKKRIAEAIAPYGYFNPHMTAHLYTTQTGWLASYTIELGQPVRVRTISLQLQGEGADDPRLQAYLQKLPIHAGEVFESKKYDAMKEKLYEIANAQGYIKAHFRQAQIFVDRKKLTADILLIFNTQQRYYFGSLIFNETRYDPAFLARFNIFRPREPFSSDALIQYQQEMNDSSYFNQVLVIPQLEKIEDHHIPLQVSVVPPKARRYYLGLGYGSFTGPRLSTGIHFNRVNGMGHAADLQFKLSSVLTGFAAKYFIPGRQPLYEQWSMGYDHQKFKPKNGDSFSRSLSFGYQYKKTPWAIGGNVNYLIERYTANNSPFNTSELLYPRLSLSYVKADNVILPTEGKSMNVLLQGASKAFFSSTSFMQGDLKGKYFYKPFSYGNFILRGELGYTVVHDLSDLPLSMRFFTGGVSTLRGYPDSSIGPGRYLELGSIEYQHHVTENWLIAFFYDVGTATNTLGTPLNKGDGVGLIYRSVIGPIRLYLATALSKPNRPYQVEFSMGPEF